MELKLCTYATVTTLGDFGPWISKVVLDLPCTVRANDIDANTFHIYVERHERSGDVLMRKERGADHAAPSVGYIDILAAYPCDENGRKLAVGTHVALEVAEQRLTKKIEGGVMGSRMLDDQLHITQLAALPGNDGDPFEDRLRKELVDRLKSVRTIRNRIGHDENLLRVEFAKLRYDMFFILDALGPECPNWAFPDKGEALKTLNPARCIATWQNDSEDRK